MKCQACHDTRGGVKGNNNLFRGVVLCDYCHADLLYARFEIKGVMAMVEQLKRLTVNILSMEDLIMYEAFAVLMKERYEGLDIAVPDWLTDKLRQLRRGITDKVDETRALELRDIRKQIEAKTPDSEKLRKLKEREKELAPLVEVE